MVKNPEDQQLPKHSDQLPDTTVHTSGVDGDETHNQQQLADCIAALFPLTRTILSLVRYSIHLLSQYSEKGLQRVILSSLKTKLHIGNDVQH